MKIEGIPDGWELLRVDKIMPGDWYVDHSGSPRRHEADNPTTNKNYVIIRRIPPPLSIPPKVFDDGWVFQDRLSVYWSPRKPKWLGEPSQLWTESSTDLWYRIPSCVKCTWFDDIPYNERICRVTWEHGSECDNG